MGNESIGLGLKDIYRSWLRYRKGKKHSKDLDYFQYNLEKELFYLHYDLNNNIYIHGGYERFTVRDNKTREISVALVRDRILHRLLYDYLVKVYDETFIYDVWSCRKGKGLHACLNRTQEFLRKNPNAYIWKCDIKKFFDNVDHKILKELVERKIADRKAINLINAVIDSYHSNPNKGISIGNLTSQIFSNIYLNELDRFIKHDLRQKWYLRYGDDFILINNDTTKLELSRGKIINYLENELVMGINKANDIIVKAKHGLKFLGMIIYPNGRKLTKRNKNKIFDKLNILNCGSYYGLIKQNQPKLINEFNWRMIEHLP